MIKIEDLVPGETVLVDEDGAKRLVLEVFSRTIILSVLDEYEYAADENWSERNLNDFGFTILEQPKPRIPVVGDYFDTMPFVRVRKSMDEKWQQRARLLRASGDKNSLGRDFYVMTRDDNNNTCLIWVNYCEYIETATTDKD